MKPTTIAKLEYSMDGSPWCRLSASSLKPNYLELSLDGSVWWGHSGGGSTTTIIGGNIKRISKVPWPYVKKVINVEG